MTHSTRDCAFTPDSGDVAETRLRFLVSEDEDRPARVRPMILASWHRSRALELAADLVEPAYHDAVDVDTPLTRSAEPVLRRLSEQLVDQAVSIVLTDPSGLVLSRRTADRPLERYLDVVRLAPGFSYAEEFVGTNGIGTALEAGTPTEVFGHEHFAENLETLACAGVPIHDPISGRLVGVIDLTCWRKDAESLLLTLAKTTAEQIQHALLVSSGMREFQVLQAYRQTCRRTNGIVLAVTKDAVMLNHCAQTELDPNDQTALLAHAADQGRSIPAGRRQTAEVILPTGASARMHCQQVGTGSDIAGLVVHVKLTPAEQSTETAVVGRMMLPGLVGNGALWRRACREVEETMHSRSWLLLEGEAGVGKLALLRAVQLRRQPPARSAVIDAATAADDADWPGRVRDTLAKHDTVIVQHVEQLDAASQRSLCAELDRAKRDPDRSQLWVAATQRQAAAPGGQQPLTSFFPTTVTVPPLRLHIEDLGLLVNHFLGKLGPGGHVTYSPEAMRVLMRSLWPGNVTQLQELLHEVVLRRRSGVISVEDLPPATQAVTRRVLSPLESMERDAIVRSLGDAAGNKVQAARALGMSRATIYRKIHEFGINPHS